MRVDISSKRPPISSCTAAAPAGSGSDGGGSSVCHLSTRKIIWGLLLIWNDSRTACPARATANRGLTPTCARVRAVSHAEREAPPDLPQRPPRGLDRRARARQARARLEPRHPV